MFWIEKNALYTTKVTFFKNIKKRHFPKGLVHGLFKKIDLFLICFFSAKKSQKETFFDILESKECFLHLKSEVLKKSKNRHFAKRSVHAFCQKIDLFLICFFLAKKSQKEKFFDILDSKECFLDLKSEVLKKSKTSTLCKGFSPWFLSKNRAFSHMFFFFEQKKPERNIF